VDKHQKHNLKAGNESLGRYKAFTQNKKLKIWVDEIKLIAQQKTTT
jgi:hypothetical protein